MWTQAVISLAISFLSSTIKNPRSEKAKKVRASVQKLNDATEEFLAQVPAE